VGALSIAAGGVMAAMGQGVASPAPRPAEPVAAHDVKIWDAS
jgi:hypothetical protein